MKKAFLQLHVAIFLGGFTAILGKLIELNEVLLIFYRMLISMIAMAILYYYRKKLQMLSFQKAKKMLATGVIMALHWVTFYGSVKYGNVSIALVCFSATGFFTSIIEPLFHKKKIVPEELMLGFLSIIGIAIIFGFHPHHQTGIYFGLISAVGASIFQIMNQELVENFTSETIGLYEMLGGVLFLVAFIPFYNYFSGNHYALPQSSDWKWLLVFALFCTVLCLQLQLNALKKISAFTINLSYNLEPIYGILLAFWLFKEHENLNGYFYWGVAIITLSIVLQMLLIWLSHKKSTNETFEVTIGHLSDHKKNIEEDKF